MFSFIFFKRISVWTWDCAHSIPWLILHGDLCVFHGCGDRYKSTSTLRKMQSIWDEMHVLPFLSLFSELNPLLYINDEINSKRLSAIFPMVCSVLRFDAKQRRCGPKTRRNLPESILLTSTVTIPHLQMWKKTVLDGVLNLWMASYWFFVNVKNWFYVVFFKFMPGIQ